MLAECSGIQVIPGAVSRAGGGCRVENRLYSVGALGITVNSWLSDPLTVPALGRSSLRSLSAQWLSRTPSHHWQVVIGMGSLASGGLRNQPMTSSMDRASVLKMVIRALIWP